MTTFVRALAALSIFATLASPALAHEGLLHDGCEAGAVVTAGDLTLSGAFTRATLPTAQVGGGYLTIANSGNKPDRLLGGSTEAAGAVEVHNMSTADGMMKMQHLPEGLEIPAGETVSLAPGGLHLMLMDLRRPFAEGECVEVTLEFEQAGAVPVILVIGPVGADAPPDHSGH